MDIEQKILKEIHCRYNFYISTQAYLSNLYTGYVKDNKINPGIVDLFLLFLNKINFPNPEKTQTYIYEQIEKNIDNNIELNNLFQRFKKKVKDCKYPDYRDDKNWRNFIDKKFDWNRWDRQRKNNPRLFNRKDFNSAIERDNT